MASNLIPSKNAAMQFGILFVAFSALFFFFPQLRFWERLRRDA